MAHLPSAMLTLNSMPHGEHHYSSSMVATGREPTLPPDLAAPGEDLRLAPEPSSYVGRIQRQMREIHARRGPSLP